MSCAATTHRPPRNVPAHQRMTGGAGYDPLPRAHQCIPHINSSQARVFEIVSPRAATGDKKYRPLIKYQTLGLGGPSSLDSSVGSGISTPTNAAMSPRDAMSPTMSPDNFLTIEEATPQNDLTLHPESEVKCNDDVGVTPCFLKRV